MLRRTFKDSAVLPPSQRPPSVLLTTTMRGPLLRVLSLHIVAGYVPTLSVLITPCSGCSIHLKPVLPVCYVPAFPYSSQVSGSTSGRARDSTVAGLALSVHHVTFFHCHCFQSHFLHCSIYRETQPSTRMVTLLPSTNRRSCPRRCSYNTGGWAALVRVRKTVVIRVALGR
jgi:hypothetical protein